MDPETRRQGQPEQAPAPYAPFPSASAVGQPSYNGALPGSTTIPYRPRPDAPENTYPPPIPSGAAASYPPPPVQVPLQTSSTISAPPPSYMTNPAQPLTHISPKPIADPAQVRFGPFPGPEPNTFAPPPPTSTGAPATIPNHTTAITTTNHDTTLNTARASTQSALKELLAARRQRAMVNGVNGVNATGRVESYAGAEVEERVRRQTAVVLQELRGLRKRVGELGERAEGERWRRVVVGGVVASFIPLVKRLLRRPKHDEDESANRTEYAFKKSRSLVARILASTHRPGLGTLAFFVFAVLYVFQNEVSLRVARTVTRRLKRLEARVEEGRDELTEDDVKVLQGWRWRVLAWSE